MPDANDSSLGDLNAGMNVQYGVLVAGSGGYLVPYLAEAGCNGIERSARIKHPNVMGTD
jgi:hypothetical protein